MGVFHAKYLHVQMSSGNLIASSSRFGSTLSRRQMSPPGTTALAVLIIDLREAKQRAWAAVVAQRSKGYEAHRQRPHFGSTSDQQVAWLDVLMNELHFGTIAGTSWVDVIAGHPQCTSRKIHIVAHRDATARKTTTTTTTVSARVSLAFN